MFQRTRAKTIRVKTMDIVSKLADQRNELSAVTVWVLATSGLAVTRVSNETRIQRFSFECRNVIGFALTTQYDWFKNSRHFFIQSRVKPKPIMTRSHAFSPRFTSATCDDLDSFDWFTALFCSL